MLQCCITGCVTIVIVYFLEVVEIDHHDGYRSVVLLAESESIMNGNIEGYAYAGVFYDRAAYDHSCEVTIYLDRDSHLKGYGKSLYETLENELKARHLINLYACIADPVAEDEYLTRNSEQFHEHLGYIKVGEFHKCGYKFGRWYNMIWMEKIIGEHK